MALLCRGAGTKFASPRFASWPAGTVVRGRASGPGLILFMGKAGGHTGSTLCATKPRGPPRTASARPYVCWSGDREFRRQISRLQRAEGPPKALGHAPHRGSQISLCWIVPVPVGEQAELSPRAALRTCVGD
jgi:hypothetical protein